MEGRLERRDHVASPGSFPHNPFPPSFPPRSSHLHMSARERARARAAAYAPDVFRLDLRPFPFWRGDAARAISHNRTRSRLTSPLLGVNKREPKPVQARPADGEGGARGRAAWACAQRVGCAMCACEGRASLASHGSGGALACGALSVRWHGHFRSAAAPCKAARGVEAGWFRASVEAVPQSSMTAVGNSIKGPLSNITPSKWTV